MVHYLQTLQLHIIQWSRWWVSKVKVFNSFTCVTVDFSACTHTTEHGLKALLVPIDRTSSGLRKWKWNKFVKKKRKTMLKWMEMSSHLTIWLCAWGGDRKRNEFRQPLSMGLVSATICQYHPSNISFMAPAVTLWNVYMHFIGPQCDTFFKLLLFLQ